MATCSIKGDPLFNKLEEAVGIGAAHSFLNRHNGEIDFLENMSEAEIKQMVKDISHNREHTTPLNHIKILLTSKKDKLDKSNTSNKESRIEQIDVQLRKLEELDEVTAIAEIIDYLHAESIGGKQVRDFDENGVVTSKKIRTGWVGKLDVYIHNLNKDLAGIGNLSKEDKGVVLTKAINTLQAYYDYADSLEFVDKYKDIYDSSVSEQSKPTKGSTIAKMNELATARANLKAKYKQQVLPIVSQILYELHSKDANLDVKKDYDQTMAKLSRQEKEGKDVTAKKAEAKKRFMNHYVTMESIQQRLQEINSDINWFDKMITPMISLGDYTLSLFAKFVNKGFFEVQENIRDFRVDAMHQYDKFIKAKGGRKAPHELNKNIIETVTYYAKGEKRVANSLVQRVNVSKYNEAKQKLIEATKDLPKDDKMGRLMWKEFFQEHTQPLQKNDIVEFGQVIKGVDSLVKEMQDKLSKGIISKETFNNWIIENLYNKEQFAASKEVVVKNGKRLKVVNRESYANALVGLYNNNYHLLEFKNKLSKPNEDIYGNNPKWNALYSYDQSTGEWRPKNADGEYHQWATTEYLKDQELIPQSRRNNYILPFIHKDEKDMILEGNVKGAVKQKLKTGFTRTVEDSTEQGDLEHVNLIPIHYSSYIEASKSSVDVLNSILEYKKMASTYEAVSKIEPISNAFKILIDSRDTLDENSAGNFVSRAGKLLGIEDYIKKQGIANSKDMVDMFISQHIYGHMNKLETLTVFNKEINVGKIVNAGIGFSALTMLGGGDFLKSTANWFQAQVQKQIEASAKKFLNRKNLAYGEGQLIKHTRNILNDFANVAPVSLEGQIIDKYDFIQGKFMDEFGKERSGGSLKKLSTSGTYMFLTNAAEYQTQVSFGFAMMDTVKLKDASGKEINLKEAYELIDGKLRIKAGVTKQDGTEWTLDDDFEFMKKIHALNKRMNGVYNSFDRPLAKKWAIYRLLLLFKGFLAPTVKKRFKGYGSDQELGSSTEGFYITFYKTIYNDRQNLIKHILRKENDLTDLERENLNRALFEHFMIAALMLLTFALGAAGEDDEELKDNYAFQFGLYQATRAASELRFYQPGFGLKDQFKLFMAPSAANATVQRWLKFGGQLMGYSADEGWAINDTYKSKSGWNEKGDSKLLSRLYTLLGYNGNNMYPSQAIEIFHRN